MKIRNIIITLVSAIALLISASTISFAKVVGDKIILSPTTFAKDIVDEEIKRAITETNVISIFLIFILFFLY